MKDVSVDYLIALFEKNNIPLTKRQACQFYDYFELLVSWNDKINLTAITEYKDVCLKHFLDSASMSQIFTSFDEMVTSFSNKSIIDVGTGAGFPGIPLKILCPSLKVTLADSLDKRIKFLNEVIGTLGLEGISTIHGRAEDLAHESSMRESFDYATARAVAALPVLSEYCLPFVKVGGSFIAMKSEKASEELSNSKKALSVLGGEVSSEKVFDLNECGLKRDIIVIKKISNTPNAYPRKAGTPSKKPL